MDNQRYTDEIDLKQLGKRVVNIIRNKKKVFSSLLIAIMLLSTIYFLKVVFLPNYRATLILKSKYVKYDQLKQNIDQYNYHLDDPNLNPLNSDLEKAIDDIKLNKLVVTEIVNKEDILKKDNDNKYKLYSLDLIFKVKPNIDNIEKSKNKILENLQIGCSKDNEVLENKVRLTNSIRALDSLIQIALNAGSSYKDKIAVSNSGQLLVMNDLYKGINELTTQKTNSELELAMYQDKNIIFQSSSTIVSNKMEYPVIIFLWAFMLWFVIVSIWMFFLIIFSDLD